MGFRMGFSLTAAALLLASCGQMPKIGGLEPPISLAITGAPADPQYRDLADLPPRPMPPDSAKNQETVQALSQERAKTTEEAARLRKEPFATPEPGMRVPVEE